MGYNNLPRKGRKCEVCGGTRFHRKNPGPEEPNILAITPIVAWRGKGKFQLKNAAGVRVCEDCLAEAFKTRQLATNIKANSLWVLLRKSISERYKSMVEADADV
jgi:hypothetical protein